VDGAQLDAALEEARTNHLALHGMLVVRHGVIVKEAYFAPYRQEILGQPMEADPYDFARTALFDAGLLGRGLHERADDDDREDVVRLPVVGGSVRPDVCGAGPVRPADLRRADLRRRRQFFLNSCTEIAPLDSVNESALMKR
jgi:hypothetical protein